MARGAHAPTRQAKSFKIRGATGDSRSRAKQARPAQNQEMRTRRCVVCLKENYESYPIHSDCHRKGD